MVDGCVQGSVPLAAFVLLSAEPKSEFTSLRPHKAAAATRRDHELQSSADCEVLGQARLPHIDTSCHLCSQKSS